MRGAPKVYALIGMSFLFAGGLTSVSPVLPAVVQEFDVSLTGASLLLSVFAGARVLGGLAGGPLADRVRMAPVVAGASAMTLAGSVTAIVTSDFTMLLVARAVQGAGTALYLIAATGYIMDVTPPGRLPTMLAWNQSLLLVGISLGPTLGGLSALVWGYRGPFVLFACFAFMGLLVNALFLRGRDDAVQAARGAPSTTADGTPIGRGRAVVLLLLAPTFLAVLSVSFVAGSIRGGIRSTIAPLFAAEVFGFDAAQLGYTLTAAGVANLMVMYPVARSIERFGWRKVGVISTVLCTFPIAAFAYAQSGWHLVIILCLLSIIGGFAGVVAPSAIAELAPTHIRKTAIGIDRAVRDVAFMVSPVAVTAFAIALGYPLLFLLFSGVVLLVGIGLGVVILSRPSHGGETQMK